MEIDELIPTLLIGAMIIGVVFCVVFLVGAVIDSAYYKPEADDRANNYCRQSGFDQYKSYSRVGFLSKQPVAIQCEYAERYTDLGIRTNP